MVDNGLATWPGAEEAAEGDTSAQDCIALTVDEAGCLEVNTGPTGLEPAQVVLADRQAIFDYLLTQDWVHESARCPNRWACKHGEEAWERPNRGGTGPGGRRLTEEERKKCEASHFLVLCITEEKHDGARARR